MPDTGLRISHLLPGTPSATARSFVSALPVVVRVSRGMRRRAGVLLGIGSLQPSEDIGRFVEITHPTKCLGLNGRPGLSKPVRVINLRKGSVSNLYLIRRSARLKT